MRIPLAFLISMLVSIVLLGSGCTGDNNTSDPIPTNNPQSSTVLPASFSLSNLQIVIPSDGFHPKKSVSISVNVKNIGGTTGNYTAILSMVGENESFDFPKTITLYQGFNETISWDITTNSYGDFNISVDNLSASFTVPDPVANFPDPIFEALIRWKIEKPIGPIYGSDLLSITRLSAMGTAEGIQTIAGIEYCLNLEEIYFESTLITDLTPLSELSNLTFLMIWGNSIRDIAPLSKLTQLKNLMLVDGFIREISHLNTLVNLEELWLSTNMITDISPVSGLSKLKVLYLTRNQISDISPLSQLTGLEELSLDSNIISDISPLTNLTNLNDLDLGSNLIGSISPLSNLLNLDWVWIDNNLITDIHPLIVNQGISSSNGVYLVNNPLNSVSTNVYIPQLKSRGVLMGFNEIMNAMLK